MAGDENKHSGKQIGGNYRIVAELGRGGFGDVYLAQHIFFANRPQVAIKLLRASLFSPKERERFIQEAQLLNMLTHVHILPILDAGMQEDLPYIVMEYAPGGSLQDRLDKNPGQPFPIDAAITLLTQIGEALHYAHQQNIVHRDLKPDNILFNAKGEAVLADFGIAAILSSGQTRREAGNAGTPAYMAPELFRGIVSVKSDQYALGCIAYELVTGRKPFEVDGVPYIAVQNQHTNVEPTAPTEHNPRIPSHINKAILTAMAKDRANRHADVRVFLNALQALQKTSQEWRMEGYTLNNQKRYADALTAYEQAIRLDPNDAITYYNKGIALRNLQRYLEALAASEQALRLDPNVADYYNSKGIALRNLQRYAEALTAFEQALRLDPNYADYYNGKGLALSGLQRYVEALAVYDQAIRLDPNYAVAYYNKGVALRNLQRYVEALAVYDQAIRLNPNDADYYNSKGVALFNLKRYAEALAAFEQAIRLDPTYAIAYHSKGVVLDKLGRKTEAQQAYEKAKQLGYKG